MSRKEDWPEGARDGDSAPLRTVSPSNGLAPPLDRSEPRGVGWGQDTAKQGSRAVPAASRKVPHGRAEPLPIWCRVHRYAPEAAVRVSRLS